MTDTNIDTLLEPLAEIGRGWVIDQLDGTSFIKDALDGIEEVKAEAKAQIKQLITDELAKELEILRQQTIQATDPSAYISDQSVAQSIRVHTNSLIELRLAALQGEKE